MGRRSREKGAAWERELAHILGEALGVACRRGLGQCRAAGESADIEADGLPWRVEAKCGQRPNLLEALAQVEEAGASVGDTRPALVAAKRDRTPPVVCLRLRDFLDLARKALRAGAEPPEVDRAPEA